jgi:hypothetical protein
LNQRLLRPERSALAMLSYTPLLVIAYRFILKIRGKPVIASPKSQRECLDARYHCYPRRASLRIRSIISM